MPTRYIYLNEELAQKLKQEENASRLICNLLEEHYKKTDINSMSEEELLKELKRQEILKEAIKQIERLK